MAKRISQAVGADVRAWLRDQGRTVGARGKFSVADIEAFNQAHKGVSRYTPGNTKTVDLKVKVESASGKVRSEVRAFPESQVRAAAGEVAGKRGPLSSKALEAAAAALSA